MFDPVELGIQNRNVDCYNDCQGIDGACDFCGIGYCCREGMNTDVCGKQGCSGKNLIHNSCKNYVA